MNLLTCQLITYSHPSTFIPIKNPVFTEARRTWKLSLPIILAELSQVGLGLIDTAMVGAISYRQLAAAALVNSVINIPFVLGVGLALSISQNVSMAHGRRDAPLVSHYFYNGFWLCAFTALLIAAGLHVGSGIVFHLGQDAEVAALARPYLKVIGWSLVPMLLFMAMRQFTDGLEHTRIGMVLSIAALPANAFLNWLFIYGKWGLPRLELYGAGIATLLTRLLMFLAIAALVLGQKRFRRYRQVSRRQWKLKKETWRSLLRIGIPSSLQIGMESGAFAVSGILIGTIGALEQAAHQIALSFAAFTFMVSMGLSQGGAIRASNAWGRNDWNAIRLIGKGNLISALAYGTFCATGFILFRNYLPAFFTNDDPVMALAAYLLLFAGFFQISDATQSVAVGLLRGVKDVKVPTLYVAMAYWLIGIPTGCLMAFYFKMGAAGMWIGFVAGLTFSSLLLNRRFGRLVRRKQPDKPMLP